MVICCVDAAFLTSLTMNKKYELAIIKTYTNYACDGQTKFRREVESLKTTGSNTAPGDKNQSLTNSELNIREITIRRVHNFIQ